MQGLDGDLLGHLAEDTGMTDEQFQVNLPTDVPGSNDQQTGHMARDANMTDEEYRAEAGSERPSGEGHSGFTAFPPD